MLELWNGGHLDPADVYARGCLVDERTAEEERARPERGGR
jgi:hypothetical protein